MDPLEIDLPLATHADLPAPPRARLRVEGREIRDVHGRTMLLRGVNGGGRSKFAPFVPFTFTEGTFDVELDRYMRALASWGANVIRMPFSWEALEPDRGRFDDAYLDRYEAMVDAAWAHGMYVLVDFHQDVYASPFSGDGFPLWTLGPILHGEPRRDMPDGAWFPQYHDASGPVAHAFERFYANEDGIFDAFLAMWRKVAARLGGKECVVGLEIMNEPGWGTRDLFTFEREVLPEVWRKATGAVREIVDVAVALGGPGADALMGMTGIPNPNIARMIYAPHFYDLAVATGGAYRGKKSIAQGVETLSAVGEAWGCPVLFGEFGAADHSPDKREFLRDLYSLFDEARVHATVWEVSFSSESWNHEVLGIANPDGSEREAVSEVVRAYPRAVCGEVERFVWEEQRFALRVTNATRGVSEIYVPERYVGDAPRITLSSGRVSWKRGVLYVESDAKEWTLRVERA